MIAVVAIIAAAMATVLGTASGATSYTVGEPGGSWDLQTNLTAWASTVDFHPGDPLVFKYDASAHDVVEVTQAGYTSCSAAASPVAGGGTHQTGSDAVVELNGVGVRYFVCGKPGHCGAGMKLAVRVTPVCRNDSSGFINTICFNVPLGGAASAAGLGSLLVTVVSLARCC
jgi:hypothetical protein